MVRLSVAIVPGYNVGALAMVTHDSVLPVTTDLTSARAGDQVYLVVEAMHGPPAGRIRANALLARLASLEPAALRSMLEVLPATLPLPLAPFAEGGELLERLSRLGITANLVPAPASPGRCPAHPRLDALEQCQRCSSRGCPACVKRIDHKLYCPRCQRRYRWSRGFFLMRVSVLLTLLVLVAAWGYGDRQSRNARTSWQRTLSVAIVVVTTAPLQTRSIERLEERLGALEDQLTREFSRYREGPRPFHFVLQGPVQAARPPAPPNGTGLLQLAASHYQRRRYVSSIDRALDLDAGRYDSRIYLVARPPERESVQFVEGYGEQGGRVGIVEVELSEAMVDLVLAVAAHELFHTLGAEDKYDASGRTSIPEGLADPEATPRFPQQFVEIMARNRPISPTRGRPLGNLAELKVGAVTAHEVGWSRPAVP